MSEDYKIPRRAKHRPTYITVPRKLVTASVAAFICMLIMTMLSVQWSNYVNKRSNQRLCSVVTLFNQAYKATPPTTKLGRQIAVAMQNLENDLSCEHK